MIIYHATEKRNLKSILKKGLKRNSYFEKAIFFAENLNSVYIWRDILDAGQGLKWIILKVNLPKKDLKFIYLEADYIKEILYKKADIRPEKIKIVK